MFENDYALILHRHKRAFYYQCLRLYAWRTKDWTLYNTAELKLLDIEDRRS